VPLERRQPVGDPGAQVGGEAEVMHDDGVAKRVTEVTRYARL
jgi:hypothetical protein